MPWFKSISKETKSGRVTPHPLFITEVFRARIDLIQETGMGKDLHAPFFPSWMWCWRLPLARGTGLTPCLLRNPACLHHSGVLQVSCQDIPEGWASRCNNVLCSYRPLGAPGALPVWVGPPEDPFWLGSPGSWETQGWDWPSGFPRTWLHQRGWRCTPPPAPPAGQTTH